MVLHYINFRWQEFKDINQKTNDIKDTVFPNLNLDKFVYFLTLCVGILF